MDSGKKGRKGNYCLTVPYLVPGTVHRRGEKREEREKAGDEGRRSRDFFSKYIYDISCL